MSDTVMTPERLEEIDTLDRFIPEKKDDCIADLWAALSASLARERALTEAGQRLYDALLAMQRNADESDVMRPEVGKELEDAATDLKSLLPAIPEEL